MTDRNRQSLILGGILFFSVICFSHAAGTVFLANGTGNGTVTVIAEATDGSGVKAQKRITLTHQPNLPRRYALCARLGRGVNLGNALEAPVEGTWGVTLEEEYFRLAKEIGFDSVRIPINWSTDNRTEIQPPYTISEKFFKRIDWVIENAFKNNLSVILCMHHYNELYKSPEKHKQRFMAIWKQIAERYKDYPDTLYFELLNEPHDNLRAEQWNSLFAETLSIVRLTNPTRMVIVGPDNYNSIDRLDELVLPKDDNLIATVHYYEPNEFVNQGADWMDGMDQWLGTTWDNFENQRDAITAAFEKVKEYSIKHQIPVYVGEFGTFNKGDIYSRKLWTNYVARTIEKYGFSWGYWEFCDRFGIYDKVKKEWRTGLVNALLYDPLYPAVVPEKGTLVYQSDFSKGLIPWVIYLRDPAMANMEAHDGICHVKIERGGNQPYDIQLTCPGLTIETGKIYQFSFDAYAAQPVETVAYLAQNVSPWTIYSGYSTFSITTERKTYSSQFTMMKETDPHARMSFDMGLVKSDVFINNVTIQEQVIKVAEIELEGENGLTGIHTQRGSLQLTARVYPLIATNKDVSWKVENITGKAVITQDGKLTAMGGSKSNGIVRVVAKANDGSNVVRSMLVEITHQSETP